MGKVRIVHLINSLNPGGGERFLVDLARQLPREGFDCRVVCLYKRGDFADEIEAGGVPVSVIGVPRQMGWEGYKRVYQVLRSLSTDIVHCHLLEACWYGLPAGWMAGVPLRIAHLQNCHWHLRLKLKLFDRFAFQFADAAFACSRAVADFYTGRMWYPVSKLHVVHNAVDPTRFEDLPRKDEAKRRLGLGEDDVILTTVASLTPQKGHQYLLQAAKEIVRRWPSTKFLFVGDGGLRDRLQGETKALGIEPWVRFLGERLNVPAILAASDIFVLPSLWEGFGLVLVEAGLAGLPVIASSVDGTIEIIQDRRNGLLVRPKDIPALVEACLELIGNRSLRERMGKEGKRIALERFSIRQIASRVADLYGTLLERTRR